MKTIYYVYVRIANIYKVHVYMHSLVNVLKRYTQIVISVYYVSLVWFVVHVPYNDFPVERFYVVQVIPPQYMLLR
jgi:hypothetical protein